MFDKEMNFEENSELILARELEEQALEARIVRELERVPETSALIPTDFAAHVAAKVPIRRPVSVRHTHYGRAVMGISLVVLLIALVILDGREYRNSAIGFAVESILCIQFLAIAVWGLRNWRSS